MSTLYFPGVKTARDANNNVVPFAKRYVYAAQSDVLRPIFEDSGLTGMLGNPLVADAAGTFPLVHLLSGSYRVVDEDPRGTRLNEVTDLHIAPIFRTGDAHCFPTRAALLADDLLSYSATDSNSAVAAGMHIQVAQGGWIFEVAPDTASDAAYTTGGGLRLYEAGTVYTTKARFLAALARGIQFDVGATVLAEGTLYRFADDGNTDLTGLAGWTQGGISDALDLRLGALETNVGQALAASGAAVFADR
ncbi:MAG: hypothetical protein ACPGFC_03180, partial [Paracoccaceae bacterium]